MIVVNIGRCHQCNYQIRHRSNRILFLTSAAAAFFRFEIGQNYKQPHTKTGHNETKKKQRKQYEIHTDKTILSKSIKQTNSITKKKSRKPTEQNGRDVFLCQELAEN